MLKISYSNKIEAGCDESGRGCLAGPVVAASVIFSNDYVNESINDSKKLSCSKREELFEVIKSDALSYSIGISTPKEIDKINILNASILAMHRALKNLKLKPQFILVDGNKFNNFNNIPYKCIIKGDSKFLSIAAASIIAKQTRDNLMNKLHEEFPNYNWKKNKGYPTKEHKRKIHLFGINAQHRKSFKLDSNQLKLYL